MKHDEELRRIIRREFDEAFSDLNDKPSLHNEIMKKIEGERVVKRKISMTLVFAIVMMLALGGMAVAAGLGLFGQLRVQKVDEMSYERLGLLEDAAAVMGETRSIVVPVREEAAKPETVHDQASLYNCFTGNLITVYNLNTQFSRYRCCCTFAGTCGPCKSD